MVDCLYFFNNSAHKAGGVYFLCLGHCQSQWAGEDGNWGCKKADWRFCCPQASHPLDHPSGKSTGHRYSLVGSLLTLNASGQNFSWRRFNINYNVNYLNKDYFWTLLSADISRDGDQVRACWTEQVKVDVFRGWPVLVGWLEHRAASWLPGFQF